MDDGKNEFYNLIVYLNKNKIDLTKTLGTYLSDLIKKWNNKNKTIRDYFEIKDIHPNIANYFLSSSNQELKQLWITYIAKFMEFRINIVANKYYEHKNINLEKAKQYLDDKNIKYTIHNNEFTNEPVITINENATITILESNDWNEIKRHIDSKINMQIKYECSICLSNNLKKTVSCNKCACYWCIPCYAEIFKVNRGLIKCPFCRYEFGKTTDDDLLLNFGYQQILSNN